MKRAATPGMNLPEHEGSQEAGQSRAERASQDTVDAELRGFGLLGVLATIVILVTGNVRVAPMVFVPVGAILVLL